MKTKDKINILFEKIWQKDIKEREKFFNKQHSSRFMKKIMRPDTLKKGTISYKHSRLRAERFFCNGILSGIKEFGPGISR